MSEQFLELYKKMAGSKSYPTKKDLQAMMDTLYDWPTDKLYSLRGNIFKKRGSNRADSITLKAIQHLLEEREGGEFIF